MEIGDAYQWMKQRLEGVSARSQDPSFKAEAAEAIDNFETVKAKDGRPSSYFGLVPVDEADNQDVQVPGVARLRDLGDRLHFRLERPGTEIITPVRYDFTNKKGIYRNANTVNSKNPGA